MTTRRASFRNTWLPIDPEHFPYNLDVGPQDKFPILPYDAANVLPTAEGYSSFFGILEVCPDDILPAHVFDMFSYQDSEGNLIQIAYGDRGVYASYGACASPRHVLTGNGFEVTNYA